MIEFSQFTNGGVAQPSDIIVGLKNGLNAKFTFPSVTGTTWNLVTTNTTMSANNGYVVDTLGTVTLTVPPVLAFGDCFDIVMYGGGRFVIQCGTDQQIRAGTTTTSVGGYLMSGAQGDVIRLLACSTTQLMALSGVSLDFTLV